MIKKQEDCPYCHDEKPIILDQNVTGKKADYVKIYIKNNQLISLTKVKEAKSVQVRNLVSCPICGRKLNEKENR